ncbi:hypothetical protein D3C78_1166490 [compost metagenome]
MADQVGARVTDDLQPLFVLGRDDLQAGIVLDQVAGVDQLAVDLAGDGGFGEARTNGCGDFGNGNCLVE